MTNDNTEESQANAVIEELRKLLSQAQEILEQVKNEKDTVAAGIQATSQQLSELKTKQQSVSEQLTALESQRDTIQNLVNSLHVLKAEAETNKNSVSGDIQTITQAKVEFDNLKNQAQTARDELTNKQNELAGKISEINSAYDRVTQQQKVLFDDSTDQGGTAIRAVVNQIHDSNTAIKTLLAEVKRESEGSTAEIKSHLEESKNKITALNQETESNLKDFIEQSTVQITTLKGHLEREITSLLPKAGAAGLASTFYEAKSKYAITSIEPKVDSIFLKYFLKLRYYFISLLTSSFFYAMFIVPLLGIFYIFYDVLESLKKLPIPASGDIHIDTTMLLFRFMLALPLVVISAFGWSSIRLYRRLYEEYNHKQRVMQLYHSFKEEIGDSEDHKKPLLAIMLAAVGDKPSLAMNHYDQNVGNLLSAFDIRGVLRKALGEKSQQDSKEDEKK